MEKMMKNTFFKSVFSLATALVVTACGSMDEPQTNQPSVPNTQRNSADNVKPYEMGNVGSGSLEDFRQNVGDRVFFDTAAYTLSYEAKNTLASQAMWLKKYAQNRSIMVEGHADERGTRAYNMALGARRANSVRSFLVSQGVPMMNLKTISYGKERPAVEGSNANAWAQNRRVIIAPQ